MDREIPVREKKKRQRKSLIKVLSVLVAAIFVSLLLYHLLNEKLNLNNFHTGRVDRGSIEITINATGKLVPLFEEIIVSPINSRILEVYKNPGDSVLEGESLLKLDLASIENEYRQKLDEKEVLKSRMVQVEVRLSNSLAELSMQEQLQEMRLKQLAADLESEKYLESIGASTSDKIRRSELDYEEAKLQLEQLTQKVENEKKHAEAELRVQKLELDIFEKDLEEKSRLMKNARILSPKTATLTFIQNQIGASVVQGAQLAVVSDLTRYKVECEISDRHREKLIPGSQAVVLLGQERMGGIISSVTPSVANGLVNFAVILEDSSNKGLRSGLNVDVHVLHGLRSDVLRIPNGRYYHGPGSYYMWIVDGGRAVKKNVKLGDGDFEYVEVSSGLVAGDNVIIDDMDRYSNKTELRLK